MWAKPVLRRTPSVCMNPRCIIGTHDFLLSTIRLSMFCADRRLCSVLLWLVWFYSDEFSQLSLSIDIIFLVCVLPWRVSDPLKYTHRAARPQMCVRELRNLKKTGHRFQTTPPPNLERCLLPSKALANADLPLCKCKACVFFLSTQRESLNEWTTTVSISETCFASSDSLTRWVLLYADHLDADRSGRFRTPPESQRLHSTTVFTSN